MATPQVLAAVHSEVAEYKIRFKVHNISKLKKKYHGPNLSTLGMTFTPMIKPCENKVGRFTTLGFFFKCHFHRPVKEAQKHCKVLLEFRLISQEANEKGEKTKDLIRNTKCTYSSTVPDWGYREFIQWHEMIKTIWMKDDTILLEVSFTIEESFILLDTPDEEDDRSQTTAIETDHDKSEADRVETGVAKKANKKAKKETRRQRKEALEKKTCIEILKEIRDGHKKFLEDFDKKRKEKNELKKEAQSVAQDKTETAPAVEAYGDSVKQNEMPGAEVVAAETNTDDETAGLVMKIRRNKKTEEENLEIGNIDEELLYFADLKKSSGSDSDSSEFSMLDD